MRIQFLQDLCDTLRGKKKKKKKPSLSPINVTGQNNAIEYRLEDLPHIFINVCGNNNKVIIKSLAEGCGNSLRINIFGNNCEVVIGDNFFAGCNCTITLGHDHSFHGKISHARVYIGNDVRMEDVFITTYNSNNKIVVGDNCLFSLNVHLYNTDGHPIYDLNSGKLLNYVSDMIIGNNCWIGYNATLLKGIQLPNNTIVGWGSIVSKKFTQEYTAIAGNPAKVVKENITWKHGGDMDFINNERVSNDT